MENLESKSEYFQLKSDISAENARILKDIKDRGSSPFHEHIRRATALYDFALDTYGNGGVIHGVLGSDESSIPLFYAPADSETTSNRVTLEVNVNHDVAKILRKLGMNDSGADTSIMDNIIAHYNELTLRSSSGQKIMITNLDGTKGKLVF